MSSENPAPPPPQQQNDDVADWVGRLKSAAAQPAAFTAPTQGQKWHEGFFSCFSPIDTCLITCCCPCVTFGKTHHRLRKDPNLTGYSPLNVSCLGFWLSSYFCLHWAPQLLQRHDLKERYNLEGEFAIDCLKICCCACCDLIQQEKEAAYHAANSGGAPLSEQPKLKEEMQVPVDPTPA